MIAKSSASWGAYRSSPRTADTAAKSSQSIAASAAGSEIAVNRTLPPAPTIKARGQGPMRTTPRRVASLCASHKVYLEWGSSMIRRRIPRMLIKKLDSMV
jgi:hypothetical protein